MEDKSEKKLEHGGPNGGQNKVNKEGQLEEQFCYKM